MTGGSVVFPVDPVFFVEVSPSAVKRQAVSVAVQIGLVGFSVSVGPEAGLVSVLLAVGDVCLIEVSLYCVTSRPRFGIKQVTPSSHTAIVQPVVPVHTAAVMLALCCAATETSVVKLSVPGAAQATVIQVPLPRAAQAGVVESATTPEAEVIEVKVEEAALCAGKRHEAALRVPATQVVVVTRRGVRGRAQEGGVFGVRAS